MPSTPAPKLSHKKKEKSSVGPIWQRKANSITLVLFWNKAKNHIIISLADVNRNAQLIPESV